MTKVTILGKEPQKKELKKIELVKCLQTMSGLFSEIHRVKLSDYAEIKLISKLRYDGYNLFMCIRKDDKLNASIWLGHFNDGVV